MRLELGLDLPERRIGLSAHDFAQLLGAREVILSHAAKIAGTPTVPSRFIQRLAAIAGTRWQDGRQRAARTISPGRASSIGRNGSRRRRSRRRRRRARRGRKAFRSPRSRIGCAIPIRSMPGTFCASPARCGRHRAWRRRARHHHSRRRRRIHAEFRGRPSRRSGARTDRARRAALSPRLRIFPRRGRSGGRASLRIAHWFTRWDAERRAAIVALFAEIRGETEIALDETARSGCAASPTASNATPDGRCVILDYKTGAVRSEKQVRTGLGAAAHAGSRDAAPGRLPGHSGRRIGQRD